MKEELRQKMLQKAVDNRLPCSVARKIAEELDIPYKEVGAAADELGIRIRDCQLGCF